MKSFFIIAMLLGVAFAHPMTSNDLYRDFQAWKAKYQPGYNSMDDELSRYKIWSDNVQMIKAHNADKTQTYTMAMNQFGDRTKQEFAEMLTLNIHSKVVGRPASSNSAVDADVDWRTKGAVTPVKDQSQCGSCWAFSATGTLEGAHFIASGSLVSLSEEELMDCVTTCDCCDGGLMKDAIEYAIVKGMEKESDYPYTMACGACKYSPAKATIHFKSMYNVTEGDMDDLLATIAKGPVSIGVDASSWSFYSGGVYTGPCSTTDLDHGVLAVGYSKGQYIIVKNSWGSSWGENGYIRLSLAKTNICGVTDYATLALA